MASVSQTLPAQHETRDIKPRYAHAVPEGSPTTLCGALAPTKPSTGRHQPCPDCAAMINRRGFIAR